LRGPVGFFEEMLVETTNSYLAQRQYAAKATMFLIPETIVKLEATLKTLQEYEIKRVDFCTEVLVQVMISRNGAPPRMCRLRQSAGPDGAVTCLELSCECRQHEDTGRPCGNLLKAMEYANKQHKGAWNKTSRRFWGVEHSSDLLTLRFSGDIPLFSNAVLSTSLDEFIIENYKKSGSFNIDCLPGILLFCI
jgi:hypothetical protein